MRLDALKCRLWLGALLLLVLSSCGTTSTPRAPQLSYAGGIGGTGITSGGIGGTGITGYGMVQGFGSIFVNGKEFFLDPATRVEVNGHPGSEKDLHVGDVVALEGSQDSRTGRYHAQYIHGDYQLQGVVHAVDAEKATLRLLGQIIYVAPQARLESTRGHEKLSLKMLRPGDVLGVSGFAQDGTHWMATRLVRLYPARDAPRTPHFILRGKLDDMDGHTYARIGGQRVLLTDLASNADIRPGDRVVVRGEYVRGALKAVRIQTDRILLGKPGERVDMQGYIHHLPRNGRLISNGLALDYDRNTAIMHASVKHLRVGEFIQAQGTLRPDGGITLDSLRLYREFPRPETRPPLHENATRSEENRSEAPSHPERQGAESRRPERPEAHRPEFERPESARPEKPEIHRPEVEHFEVQHPEVERPQVQKPEQPEKPEVERPQS